MDCKLCELNESSKRDYSYFKEYKHWNVRVTPIQHSLGCFVISLKRHIETFSDANEEEMKNLLEVQKDVERRLIKMFNPDRFNYIQLGNVMRHLHFHLIPRYKDPRNFAGKEWQDKMFTETPGLAPIFKQDKDPQELIEELKEELIKL